MNERNTDLQKLFSEKKYLEIIKLIENQNKQETLSAGLLNLLGACKILKSDKSDEDLIHNPESELEKIINFLKKYLNIKTNDDKNKKILKTTSFKNLKEMEIKGLFKENVLNKKDDSKVNFFHLGPANNWKDNLNEDVKNKIEKNFYNEMKELEYL